MLQLEEQKRFPERRHARALKVQLLERHIRLQRTCLQVECTPHRRSGHRASPFLKLELKVWAHQGSRCDWIPQYRREHRTARGKCRTKSLCNPGRS